jgi:hypothetical protein
MIASASIRKTNCMKFNTGALITLFAVSVLLIIGFKRIGHAHINFLYPNRQTAKKLPAAKVSEISLPVGYTRVAVQPGSFAEWLRNFPLRKNNTVYLYNGQPLADQSQHYAVLDISTGHKDLQQCADAIMRLRGEYYYSMSEYGKIAFGEGREMMRFADVLSRSDFTEKDVRPLFMQFMEKVFINCGTYTVDAMSSPIPLSSMQPGDMFVKAGSPGHAMIVVDVATDPEGKKIYLLAQGYMPAQDMHIVINPVTAALSPWYQVTDDKEITTPGWIFEKNQLKRWE